MELTHIGCGYICNGFLYVPENNSLFANLVLSLGKSETIEEAESKIKVAYKKYIVQECE